jgi:Zn-dependent protease
METFEIVGIIAIVVWSITTHEVAHGWVAYRCGDDTAKQLGRLTLNPLPHIDPFMTVVMPVVLMLTTGTMLGGARPVPVNTRRLRNPRRDMAIVAAAGPISNILIAVVLAGALSALVHSGAWEPDTMGVTVLGGALYFNLFLAAFNLFPLPPLDGSRLVAFFLKGQALEFWYRLERVGLFVLLGILFMAPELLMGFVFPVIEFLLTGLIDIFDIEEPMIHTMSQLKKAFGGS